MIATDLYSQLQSNSPPPTEALEELRQLISKGLTKTLSSRAGSNAAFIEDMVQESLLKVLAKLHTFEGRSKFSSWVLAIAIRTAFSELRRKHWGNVSLDEIKEHTSETAPEKTYTAHTPSQEVAHTEVKTLLHRLITTKLTARQRDVVLAELNGMPQDEIAHQLGSNRNAIYKAGHDARKALRRELENAGFTLEDLRTSFTTPLQP